MSDYFQGQSVRCRGLFTTNDSTNAGVDPPTITFRYRKPSGSQTNLVYGLSPSVIRLAAGAYYVDVLTDEDGTWSFRWDSMGGLVGANEGVFTVDEGSF